MSDIFTGTAEFYDLVYGKKDYEAEVNFVIEKALEYSPQIKSILDLGCGTGRHLSSFSQRNYSVTGIDSSSYMLSHAKRNYSDLTSHFIEGEIEKIDLKMTFDLIVSLFHVLSYHVREAEVSGFFSCISRHLHPGSVALVDFWNGDAVLEHGTPETRKTFQDKEFTVIRTSRPTRRQDKPIVDVEIAMEIFEREKKIGEFTETHSMRYFFPSEIKDFATQSGLLVGEIGIWPTLIENGIKDNWTGYAILRKRSE